MPALARLTPSPVAAAFASSLVLPLAACRAFALALLVALALDITLVIIVVELATSLSPTALAVVWRKTLLVIEDEDAVSPTVDVAFDAAEVAA